MKPRLVIFELHHLGDSVMALPFLRAAKRHFETSIVCRPAVAGFLRHVIDGVEIVPISGSWLPFLTEIRRKFPLDQDDAVVSVWPDTRVHLGMLLTGAGIRAGFPVTAQNYYAPDIPWRRRRLVVGRLLAKIIETVSAQPLLTRPSHRPDKTQSHLKNWEQLAQSLGFQPDYSLPWFATASQPPLAVRQLLDAHPGKPVLLLHPGGRLPTKRWPLENFQKLVSGIIAGEKMPLLIIKPPGEDVPQPTSPEQLIVREPSWADLIATMSCADLVVANDSLAAHLGAALGKKVVAIFGSGNPDWFAPFGNEDNVVATDACRFRPCIDRCVMPSTVCLETVSVDLVESRLRELLREA